MFAGKGASTCIYYHLIKIWTHTRYACAAMRPWWRCAARSPVDRPLKSRRSAARRSICQWPHRTSRTQWCAHENRCPSLTLSASSNGWTSTVRADANGGGCRCVFTCILYTYYTLATKINGTDCKGYACSDWMYDIVKSMRIKYRLPLKRNDEHFLLFNCQQSYISHVYIFLGSWVYKRRK